MDPDYNRPESQLQVIVPHVSEYAQELFLEIADHVENSVDYRVATPACTRKHPPNTVSVIFMISGEA